MTTYNIKLVEGGRLTEHFYFHEFFCNTDNACYIDADFIKFAQLLEQFRQWYNRPITINSGYRTAKVNKACGGSSNSCHLKARAIDFNYPAEFKKWGAARKAEFLKNVKTKWTQLCHDSGVYAQCNFYSNRFHLGMALDHDSFLDYR